MNVIDIILGVILLFGLGRGLVKGFFVELASLAALVLGVYGAIYFSYFITGFISKWVSWEEQYIEWTGFALTFVGIVILVSLLGRILTKLSGFIALGLVNRLLGAVFGFLKTAFLLSIVIWFFEYLNKDGLMLEKQKIETSVLYPPVQSLVPTILPAALDFAQENEWLIKDENQLGQ